MCNPINSVSREILVKSLIESLMGAGVKGLGKKHNPVEFSNGEVKVNDERIRILIPIAKAPHPKTSLSIMVASEVSYPLFMLHLSHLEEKKIISVGCKNSKVYLSLSSTFEEKLESSIKVIRRRQELGRSITY